MSGKHYKGPEVSCCIKYFIFGFNVIFWFLGIAFLGIGLWAWNEKGVLSNISSITDLGGFDPVWLFLVVGGVMFILGFAGCIGALRENTFLLKFVSIPFCPQAEGQAAVLLREDTLSVGEVVLPKVQ